MESIVVQWVERADYDLDAARYLLNGGRYLYVAFMCQQVVEKLFKAAIATQGKVPLFVHNLLRLSDEAGLTAQLTDEQRLLLADLNPYYIKARYGEYKESLSKVCDASEARRLMQGTEELSAWLKQQIR